MHIIDPKRYHKHSKHQPRWPTVLLAVLIVGVGAANYLRPLPVVHVTIRVPVPAAASPNIHWPSGGQAAIAARRYGPLGSSGNQAQLATASIAKVITALCILQKEPLAPGQAGPSYTVDATDVAIYRNYAANDGSLVPVQAGEQLSEYQALEALMIPSANNIADSLVRWVFGGQAAYAAYATTFLQQDGLANTLIGSDASGFDPSTTSTASDLAQLGLLALHNPVLMEIARQASVALPLAGTVSNYDTVLGQNGITGLKTGNNTVDAGAFLFTATVHVGSQTIPLAGSVMGAPDLNTALQEGVRLAGSLEQGFERTNVVRAGQPVGVVHTIWGTSAQIVTGSSIRLVRWEATPITVKQRLDMQRHSGVIGSLWATAGPNNSQTSLKLARPLPGPTFWWRLTRR